MLRIPVLAVGQSPTEPSAQKLGRFGKSPPLPYSRSDTALFCNIKTFCEIGFRGHSGRVTGHKELGEETKLR